VNNKTKSVLFGIGGGIVGMIILSALGIKLIISALVGVVCGAILVTVLIARSRGERPKDVAEEVIQQATQPDPDALKHRVVEQLTRLNEKIRVEGAPAVIVSATEKVIDALLEVVPRALTEAPNAVATFDLEKMSTDHLPDLLGKYLVLSNSDRELQQTELLDQLAKLEEVIASAKDFLDAGNLDEFQVSSDFVKVKTM